MKSFNIKYNSIQELEEFFIENNSIFYEQNVLIQIFSGIIERKYLEDLGSFLLGKVPNAKIIGSTTDGEIYDGDVHLKSTIISISIFQSTTVAIDSISTLNKKSDSYAIGHSLASNLITDNTKVFISFADGLGINGEEYLEGLSSVRSDIHIAGGLSGDNGKFQKTLLICQNKVFSEGAVCVSLTNQDLNIYTDFSFAWQQIGKKFTVRRAVRSRVYDIDGIAPVELYEKYLGKEVAASLPNIGIEFPLIIVDEKNEMPIARAVLSKHDDGSLSFAGSIPQGSQVRFGIGNIENIISDGLECSKRLSQNIPQSLFVYSCMARRRFLDSRSCADIKQISTLIDNSGFFTYGEFFTKDKKSFFFNETMTLLGLSEEKFIQKDIDFETQNPRTFMKTFKALSHLINTTTQELEQYTNILESQVEVEVQKNVIYEQKVFDAMKMASLGEMIANIAHQWRQPLSVITTSTTAMEVNKEIGLLDDSLFDKYTSTIVSQAMYLSDTINTFRDYIKEEHVVKRVILQEEIKNTLKILDVVLKDNNIDLINELDKIEAIDINIIVGELSQVIINIINNAKDAHNEYKENVVKKKWIKISLEKQGDFLFIGIEDNAGGILEEVLPKIFDQNFTTKDKDHGTGIGLYMSKCIVEEHLKGRIYANNINEGVKFTIVIPH